ncbi:GtrA family protein [Bacillus carboniphilus]|uniref:GtrA family protein n=1 Tax=Bacillus carboniphilus TaxID=86663 RepID=A0ABY9JTC2_9BACI|nr:GtrA family protein [Bacillus carboniphilus]WLR41538.1 GtrA family protein [Bacillus carboniphilus]
MKRFIKFGTVGIFNTLITICSFILFLNIGIHYIVANGLSYGLGVLNSYYWNRNWVFGSNSKHLSLISKFIVVNLVTLCFNTGILFIFVNHFHLHPILSNIVAVGMGLVINFLLNYKWTFK